MLLDAGADPNLANKNGDLPVELAAQKSAEDLHLLLAKGASPNSAGKDTAITPLQYTAAMPRADGLWVLLEYGATPNAAQ